MLKFKAPHFSTLALTVCASLSSMSILWSSDIFAFSTDRGKALYNLCSSCHGQNGEGNQAIGAPAINGHPEWYLTTQLVKFREGIRAGHPRDAYGHKMRPIARTLSDEDIKLISQIIAAKSHPEQKETIEGSVVKGEAQFQVCVACHGPKGEGNQALSAPPLAGGSDWYYLRQLKNFKAKYRGGNPAKDIAGSQMQGISNALDEQGMINVVSYINTLKPAQSTKSH
jgi:cbb3-type cytochrome c oxidase subunit III